MMHLQIEGVTHAFSGHEVVRDVSFSVAAGELACLVGPSGSGKSTLLRIIAGLERLQQGRITLDGHVLADGETHVETRARHIGLVFQQAALFPHLTVRQNIAFGLHGAAKQEKQEVVERLLTLINLQERGGAYPHQLSGGQQQRVALARALAPRPRIMLLDEPFANLDHALRRDMREDVLGLLRETGIPVVMVTHEPEEALVMADKMVLLRADGSLHQYASPQEIYRAPVDAEAAAFFGVINRVSGRAEAGRVVSPLGVWEQAECGVELADGAAVDIIIRPETVELAEADGAAAQVEQVRATASGWLVTARLEGAEQMRFIIPYAQGMKPRTGDAVSLRCRAAHVFAATG